jgi:sugar/nucleoside kinase (ribokinase family)
MSVTIVGTVALDSIETPFGKHEKLLGGSGTYAGSAASIFSEVNLVSIVGNDFPQEYTDYLKSKGMNVDGIKIADGKTFHWSGYYEGDMGQAHTRLTDLNVLLEFDPVIPDSAKNSKIVFMANIDPVLQKKAIEQFNNPECVILDSMNFWIENNLNELKETLKLVDILIINDQEIKQLTGKQNIIQAMREVLKLGPNRVVVKKGENGSIMFDGKEFFICPAVPLDKVVDTTGAGDSFAGAFSGYIDKADSVCDEVLRKAIVYGTLVSSHTVQGFSVDVLKTLDEEILLDKYKQFNELVAWPT